MPKPNALEALKEIVKHFDNNPASSQYAAHDLKYAIAAGRQVAEQDPITCKTCIHWDRFAQPIDSRSIYGVCNIINESDTVDERAVIAYATDCRETDITHGLHTRGDFSCILGVEKEGE